MLSLPGIVSGATHEVDKAGPSLAPLYKVIAAWWVLNHACSLRFELQADLVFLQTESASSHKSALSVFAVSVGLLPY